jgi:beta-phosphoglucomutase-like phosphatase (HAD superfamily)
LDFFDGISDGHSVVRAKPQPDVFVYAAGLVGVPVVNCVVVEDAEAGVEAALAGGMLAVGIGPESRVGKAHFCYPATAEIDLDEILQGKVK